MNGRKLVDDRSCSCRLIITKGRGKKGNRRRAGDTLRDWLSIGKSFDPTLASLPVVVVYRWPESLLAGRKSDHTLAN